MITLERLAEMFNEATRPNNRGRRTAGDVLELLSEVSRLGTEVEQVRAGWRSQDESVARLLSERDAARGEVERLRAGLERMARPSGDEPYSEAYARELLEGGS